jgi:hypothetical protein
VVTFGRVPMMFYVAHIFLLHAIAVFAAGAWIGDARWLFQGLPIISKPEELRLLPYGAVAELRLSQTRSKIAAIPWPPPMHMVTSA